MLAPITQPISRMNRVVHQPISRSNGLNRMFAAAVVNRQFCEMLLKNPQEAIQKGYLGETFALTQEESALLSTIKAKSLSDLARQVYQHQSGLY